VLADELVAVMPDKARAKQERDAFLMRTVQDMQAFAEGQGDAPAIIKACGKETPAGVAYGRMEMSYFLGVAYQRGTSVRQDALLSTQWLQKAASLGNLSAKASLGATGTALGSHG
jgi:TPR repeat protein